MKSENWYRKEKSYFFDWSNYFGFGEHLFNDINLCNEDASFETHLTRLYEINIAGEPVNECVIKIVTLENDKKLKKYYWIENIFQYLKQP